MSRNQAPSFPSGPLEGAAAPRRPAGNRGKRFVDNTDNVKNPNARRREPRPFVHGPVKVPQELLLQLVKHGKRNQLSNRIRIAVTNCIYQSPGGSDYPLAEMWAVIGRWASSLRKEKQIEGVTEKHQAWHHIQRVRVSMQRAQNDPALQNKLKHRINLFLHEALLAWDNALAAHFAKHPEDLMTPDEYAGMEVAPTPGSVDDLPIFKKPPSRPDPRPKEAVEPEAGVDNSIPVPSTPGRAPQKPRLLGGNL